MRAGSGALPSVMLLVLPRATGPDGLLAASPRDFTSVDNPQADLAARLRAPEPVGGRGGRLRLAGRGRLLREAPRGRAAPARPTPRRSVVDGERPAVAARAAEAVARLARDQPPRRPRHVGPARPL